jgi:hypothetical protein
MSTAFGSRTGVAVDEIRLVTASTTFFGRVVTKVVLTGASDNLLMFLALLVSVSQKNGEDEF